MSNNNTVVYASINMNTVASVEAFGLGMVEGTTEVCVWHMDGTNVSLAVTHTQMDELISAMDNNNNPTPTYTQGGVVSTELTDAVDRNVHTHGIAYRWNMEKAARKAKLTGMDVLKAIILMVFLVLCSAERVDGATVGGYEYNNKDVVTMSDLMYQAQGDLDECVYALNHKATMMLTVLDVTRITTTAEDLILIINQLKREIYMALMSN